MAVTLSSQSIPRLSLLVPDHALRPYRNQVCFVEETGLAVRLTHAGEIITDVECKRRMEEAKHKGEPHFYMMELQQGLIIDARDKGTVARLINSCCDPNAESQKWHDAGTGADTATLRLPGLPRHWSTSLSELWSCFAACTPFQLTQQFRVEPLLAWQAVCRPVGWIMRTQLLCSGLRRGARGHLCAARHPAG